MHQQALHGLQAVAYIALSANTCDTIRQTVHNINCRLAAGIIRGTDSSAALAADIGASDNAQKG